MYYVYYIAMAQIIGESLPISSSGHLVLLQVLWPQKLPQLTQSFDFFLHMPTALLIPLFFRTQLWSVFAHVQRTWHIVVKVAALTCVADVITVLCVVPYRYGGVHPFTVPLSFGFVCTAVILLSLKWAPQGTYRSWQLPLALLLGIVQAIALVPGISRFALTFATARWAGLKNERAVQVSLLIQWPLIFCAGLLGTYQVVCTSSSELLSLPFVCSILIASLFAFMCLSCVVTMIRNNRMWLWGWYMIVPFVLAWYVGV